MIDMTNISDPDFDPPKPELWVKIGESVLTEEDKTDLLSGEWLTDKHIDAAQELLHQQYLEISGFQRCVLQCTKTYHVQSGKKFVQILHVNANHWITISTVGCAPGNVKVYDTMHHKLSLEMKSTVADLMQVLINHVVVSLLATVCFLQVKQKFLVVEYVNVQQQKGMSDCGVLAIAIATAICHGKEPEFQNFDQSQARKHLQKALEEKVLTPFPAEPAVRRKARFQKERLRIYCYCRLIDDGRHMIRCDGCEDWIVSRCQQLFWRIKKSLGFVGNVQSQIVSIVMNKLKMK